MFKITKDGDTIGMTEAPTYVKRHENNGCFVLCPGPDASGIVLDGTVYHILGRPDLEGAETVAMEAVDAGAMLSKTQQAVEDADAMNVDQEYRLTLLELGINDDTSSGGEV